MCKILIDTCVWLDLAKDNQGQGVLGVLETLVRQKQVSIILPRTVLDEFTRNKAPVAGEGSRSAPRRSFTGSEMPKTSRLFSTN